ncbi:MAG: RdgB/HAM1 family non-canonical purine NTP pyrophosphatase [Xanthobacteraceae bacterium]
MDPHRRPEHRRLAGRVVIATHNAGKLEEMRGLLAPYGVDAVSAGELGLAEPEETGLTFAENAKLKAETAARASGLPAFADDSGLCVDALGGAPGLYTARWAGPEKDFAAAMTRVEEELRAAGATEPEQRGAYFISALCVAWPDGHAEPFEGVVQGRLVWPPRGPSGFGYDPMFQPQGYERTFGEMSGAEKHGLPPLGEGLSHRARAFLALAAACLGEPRLG